MSKIAQSLNHSPSNPKTSF